MAKTRWLSMRHVLGAITATGAAAALAACSGSQTSLSSTPATQTGAGVASHQPIQPDACRNNGGVRVTPCKIVFTASTPGPVTVDVQTPSGTKDTIVEHDNCGGASGIATITQGSGDQWIVTAGATSGRCKARFNYFNNNQLVGWAVLRINNTL
jgi:hypothetical protein